MTRHVRRQQLELFLNRLVELVDLAIKVRLVVKVQELAVLQCVVLDSVLVVFERVQLPLLFDVGASCVIARHLAVEHLPNLQVVLQLLHVQIERRLLDLPFLDDHGGRFHNNSLASECGLHCMAVVGQVVVKTRI